MRKIAPGVDDDTGHEPIADLVPEPGQPAEVREIYSGRGFDLDTDHSTVDGIEGFVMPGGNARLRPR